MPRQPKPENQLCDAPRRGKKELDPSVCQKCISPCVPGKEWLKSMGMQPPKETRELNWYPDAMPDLSSTFHSIITRRYRNYISSRL